MIFLIDCAIKASVIFGVALLATAFLRKRSAALRHWVLSAAVLSAALMPLGAWMLPEWSLSPGAHEVLSVSALTIVLSGGALSEAGPVISTPGSVVAWPTVVWFAGSSVSILI